MNENLVLQLMAEQRKTNDLLVAVNNNLITICTFLDPKNKK